MNAVNANFRLIGYFHLALIINVSDNKSSDANFTDLSIADFFYSTSEDSFTDRLRQSQCRFRLCRNTDLNAKHHHIVLQLYSVAFLSAELQILVSLT